MQTIEETMDLPIKRQITRLELIESVNKMMKKGSVYVDMGSIVGDIPDGERFYLRKEADRVEFEMEIERASVPTLVLAVHTINHKPKPYGYVILPNTVLEIEPKAVEEIVKG